MVSAGTWISRVESMAIKETHFSDWNLLGECNKKKTSLTFGTQAY